MDKLKSRQRTVGIVLVVVSILVLIAIWDLPEGEELGGRPQVAEKDH
jgi:hypothetical protein